MIEFLLSEHFPLSEMIRTAVRKENVPGPQETENLRDLCRFVLEPLRQMPVQYNARAFIIIGGIIVHSGYRCPVVNAAVGGAKDSAHMEGRAADIVALNKVISCAALVEAIKASVLPFDKVIFESPASSTWVHVQIARKGRDPRRQALMCLQPGVYLPWDPSAAALNGKAGT